jgi:hypothetical protein
MSPMPRSRRLQEVLLMSRWIAASVVALAMLGATAIAEDEQLAWLRLDTLQSGQTVFLSTAQGGYRVRMVDPKTGEARVDYAAAGQTFARPQRVFLVGATMTPQPGDGGFGLVLMGELHEGMCVEWGWGSLEPEDRRTSAPLTGIVIASPTATAQGMLNNHESH